MINPKELRIDNLIKDFTGQIWTVENLNNNFINNSPDDYFSPIELTEEWLTKLGFKNGNKEQSNCDLWGHYWIEGQEEFELSGEEGECFFLNTFDRKYKHVHEIQNLFYCLTGEELTIK